MKFNEETESSAVAGGDGDGDNSESSDWSSSSDDEEGGGDGESGEGGVAGMKPSHHTNLIAEWEWRTMADSNATRSVWGHPKSNYNGMRLICGYIQF